jgi:hypothetical protein
MVRSQIIKANGEPVNVDYMMRRTGDTWLISDIYLDGAISEVARFESIAERKLRRRQLTEDENVEISGRDSGYVPPAEVASRRNPGVRSQT